MNRYLAARIAYFGAIRIATAHFTESQYQTWRVLFHATSLEENRAFDALLAESYPLTFK